VANTLTTKAVQDKIDAIIIMGLNEMTEANFMKPSSSGTKMENAVGFCWAHRVRYAFPQLYMTLQTCANYSGITGNVKPCPTVDFTFGGCMDVAIELSTNSYDIDNKVKKFSEKGKYSKWEGRCAILNFQLETYRNFKPYSKSNIVYHFHKDSNILYRGKQIICVGAVKKLPTPTVHLSSSKITEINNRMLTVDKIMSVLRGKGIHTVEGSSEPRKRKVNDVEEDLPTIV